jgi:Flp pilus assembly protein TadD
MLGMAAGFQRTWLGTLILLGAALGFPLSGQTVGDLSADRASPRAGSVSDALDLEARMSGEAKHSPNHGLVSADFLRHPVNAKVRKLLRRALDAMNSGKHEEAIGQLKETLSKYPDSAPYVHSFLGVEYVKTQRFPEAVNSFEQAAAVFPHDAMTHYNFGLSLACAGDFDRAETETRRALELDPKIDSARELLSLLMSRKQPSSS